MLYYEDYYVIKVEGKFYRVSNKNATLVKIKSKFYNFFNRLVNEEVYFDEVNGSKVRISITEYSKEYNVNVEYLYGDNYTNNNLFSDLYLSEREVAYLSIENILNSLKFTPNKIITVNLSEDTHIKVKDKVIKIIESIIKLPYTYENGVYIFGVLPKLVLSEFFLNFNYRNPLLNREIYYFKNFPELYKKYRKVKRIR